MSYRTIDIGWLPTSQGQWRTFTLARQEAARLWGDLVARHHRIRRLGWQWPSKARWQRWAKGRYPHLSAQSAQQLIAEFCEAVESTRQLRKHGCAEARYPWHKPRYRDVIYTNQDARVRDGWLLLPHGKAGALRIKMPRSVALFGRLMEVRLSFRVVRLICKLPDEVRPQQTVVGVDLGVNTLVAATDGERAILVSGRGVKATVQWRNKRLAALAHAQSKHIKGSSRWKRLQRRKYRVVGKARRRVKDAVHKATRTIADAFPHATCYVGKPFNAAAQTMAPRQAQQVSQACTRHIIQQLDYKTSGAVEVDERYSSQTCPVCGDRSKQRRVYRCRCGYVAPRDVVGATNILRVGREGQLAPNPLVPTRITYLRPQGRSSLGGHPRTSSA
jgi:putative transposase